jgi:hypothetical protein
MTPNRAAPLSLIISGNQRSFYATAAAVIRGATVNPWRQEADTSNPLFYCGDAVTLHD